MVTKKQEQQAGRTQIVKDFKAGDISKEEASQRIRDLDRALFGGGGGSSGSVAGKSPSQIRAEANRLRQQQQQQQAQVREQMRVRQEAKATAEATKQAKVQQQKNIAIGSASQTSRWEMQNGRSVQVTNPTLKKNIGESQASFDFRAGQVGKGISASQPEAVKDFGKVKFDKRITETQELPGITLESRGLGFTVPGGQIGGGTKFIVSYTPDLTRPDVTDVTRQGTISEVPKFDTSFIFNPATSITPPSKTNGPKITVNTKDVTRQGTISPDIPQYEPPQVFDISKGPTVTERLRDKAFTEGTRGQVSLGGVTAGITAGAITSIVGGVKGTKQLIVQPVETIGRGIEAVTIKLPQTAAKVGQVIQQEPAFATGFALGEFAQFKAIGGVQKLAVRGFDRIRTINMRELLVVGPDDISFARRGRNVFFERTPTGRFKQQKFEIIAPEYPKQTFPSIKKGQTAGQLKAEFQRLLPGEKLPAGYTASPNPLGDLIVQPGSSEILGGYQAGRVSPRFLRVAAADADNLISVGILGDTLRPSVFRITPSKGFKLAPGVKSSTKSIQPLGNIKKYIETKAPKGQSTIPFIKAEKESIITQGSILSKPEAKFYFTFEGRRIPIQQTTALAEGVNLPGSISQGEFNKIVSSSSSGVGRSGVFTPVDITSQLRKGGSSVSVSSSSIAPTKITLTPPYSKVSSKKSSSISSIISSARSSTSKARPSASRSISSRFSSKISPSSSVLSKASSSVARSISSRVSSGVSRSRVRPSRIPITPKPFNNIYSGKGRTQPKLRTAKFKVLGRRFGKFKVIGTARTEKGAFQIGRKFAGSTLGVSFKIPKSKTLKLPGFRTKKEDGGIVFIEPRKRRLKKGGREVLEIQQFKGMKGGKLF